MNTLENNLIRAVEQLTIKKEDREPYTKMYDTVRDWLFLNMCEVDPVFKQLYKGTCLFGSYSNDVRIRKPDEFDTIFILEIPYGIAVRELKVNGEGKGYFEVNPKEFGGYGNYEQVYRKIKFDLVDNGKLNRIKLQKWLEDIINKVFAKDAKDVNVKAKYQVQYGKRATAHNIYAKETDYPYKTISFDFVCGLKVDVDGRNYIPGKLSKTSVYNHFNWYMVPKASKLTEYSFMLTSPQCEHEILWNKQNLKNACRLLKSLRDHYELDKIKSYFIVTCFLYEVQKRPGNYWFQPLEVILLNALECLIEFLNNKNIPYFWIEDTNLIADVHKSVIEDYKKILTKVYVELKALKSSGGLCSYQSIAKHFEF